VGAAAISDRPRQRGKRLAAWRLGEPRISVGRRKKKKTEIRVNRAPGAETRGKALIFRGMAGSAGLDLSVSQTGPKPAPSPPIFYGAGAERAPGAGPKTRHANSRGFRFLRRPQPGRSFVLEVFSGRCNSTIFLGFNGTVGGPSQPFPLDSSFPQKPGPAVGGSPRTKMGQAVFFRAWIREEEPAKARSHPRFEEAVPRSTEQSVAGRERRTLGPRKPRNQVFPARLGFPQKKIHTRWNAGWGL